MVALLALTVVVDLIAVGSDLAEIRLLDRADTPQGITLEEAERNDDRQAVIGLLQIALFVAVIVFFIAWLHRVYSNLLGLGMERWHLRFGPGWAIGSWFVPILNLWRPKQIVNDAWRASDPDAPREQADAWHGDAVPLFLLAWWIVWLVSGVIGRAYFSLSREAEELDALQTAARVLLVSDAVDAVAAVLAIVVVVRLTRRQELRAERSAGAPPESESPGEVEPEPALP